MIESARVWCVFLLKRLGFLLISLIGVSLVTFVVTHQIGDPVYLLVGPKHTQEMLDNMVRDLGLDQPLYAQYWNYIARLAQGDLGASRYSFNPVLSDIGERLPATLELSTCALVLGVLWAVPLGVIAGRDQCGWAAKLADLSARAGASMPAFWLGLLLIFVFYAELHWLPAPLGRIGRGFEVRGVTGWFTIDSVLAGNWSALSSSLRHLVLPALTLAVTTSPSILLITRNTMAEVMKSDYIRTAKSFGMPQHTISRYALRNLLVPVITMIAMTYGYLLSGTVLVEVVFTWPGLGLYAVEAMNHSDYEPIMGVVLLGAGFYLLVYLLSDILNAIIDPRIRVGG